MSLHVKAALTTDALFDALYEDFWNKHSDDPFYETTISVPNQVLASWLKEQFCARDGVCSLIEFPFLESAITYFYQNIAHAERVQDNSEWFKPPKMQDRTSATSMDFHFSILKIFETEPVLWESARDIFEITTEKPNKRFLFNFGKKIFSAFRDTALHSPETVALWSTGKTASREPQEVLYSKIYQKLSQLFSQSNAFSHVLQIDSSLQLNRDILPTMPKLYVFGMPLFSRYHLLSLIEMAKYCDIIFYFNDLTIDANQLSSEWKTWTRQYLDFKALMIQLAKGIDYRYEVISNANSKKSGGLISRPQTTGEIVSAPGKWNVAESIAEKIIFELESQSGKPRLKDIHILLDNHEDLEIPMHVVLEKNGLFPMSYQVKTGTVTNLKLLSNTLSSIMREKANLMNVRDLLDNPIVREGLHLTDDEANMYVMALKTMQGFDEALDLESSYFTLTHAAERIALSHISSFQQVGDSRIEIKFLLPFKNPLFLEKFLRLIDFVTIKVFQFCQLTGEAAIEQLLHQIQFLLDNQSEEARLLIENLEAKRQLKSLYESASAELLLEEFASTSSGATLDLRSEVNGAGIYNLHAACALPAAIKAVADLSENFDLEQEQSTFALPEVLSAVTFLSLAERNLHALLHTIVNTEKKVFLVYGNIEPISQKTIYPSKSLSLISAGKQSFGLASIIQSTFEIHTPKISKAAKIEKKSLLDFKLPVFAISEKQAFEMREIFQFVANPLSYYVQILQLKIPNLKTSRTDMEPLLSLSKSKRDNLPLSYFLYTIESRIAERTYSFADYASHERQRNRFPVEVFDYVSSNFENSSEFATLTAEIEQYHEKYVIADLTLVDGLPDGKLVTRSREGLISYFAPSIQIAEWKLSGFVGRFLKSKNMPDAPWVALPHSYRMATGEWETNAFIQSLILGIVSNLNFQGVMQSIKINTAQKSQKNILSEVSHDFSLKFDSFYFHKLIHQIKACAIYDFKFAHLENTKKTLWLDAVLSDEQILQGLSKNVSEAREAVDVLFESALTADSAAHFRNFVQPALASVDQAKPKKRK